jgi:hypothetical protein
LFTKEIYTVWQNLSKLEEEVILGSMKNSDSQPDFAEFTYESTVLDNTES